MTLDNIKNHSPSIWIDDKTEAGIRSLYSSHAELFYSEGNCHVFPRYGCAESIVVTTPEEAVQAHLRIENGDYNFCSI